MVIGGGAIPVTGGHLAYHRTGGDKPALVLSHGLTDNGLCWGAGMFEARRGRASKDV